MRTLTTLSMAAIVLLLSSCGGSSQSPSTTVAPVSPTTASTAKPTAGPTSTSGTPAASPTDTGAVDEVTGIVGSVSQATRTIRIDRLSGAPVVQIVVDSSTVLRRAGGDTITLRDVHISDRIVASGHLNDRQDALIATRVTVQDVLPGGGPGG